MELKPQNAVTIIECDINIEFDAVDGYVEPTEVVKTDQSAENQANKVFQIFICIISYLFKGYNWIWTDRNYNK
jgi:rubrerythrin